MYFLRLGLTAVCCLLLSATLLRAQTNGYVDGQLIVQLKYGQQIGDLLETVNAEQPNPSLAVSRVLSKRINIWLLDFNSSALSNDAMLRTIRKHKLVELAQFNHTNLVERVVPNDSDFGAQWNFLNDGINGGNGTFDIQAEDAWDITTGGTTSLGDSIVVAVIDGNFDLEHEDLQWYINPHDPVDSIDNDGNGYVDDNLGWNAYDDNNDFSGFGKSHGTHVSGTVGAIGNNDLGVTGVNWNVKVLPIRGSSSQEATVVAAYAYALEMRMKYNETNGDSGAYIVATNSSFGVNYGQPSNYPIWCGMYDSLGQAGVLSAGATANLSIDIDINGDIPTACASDYMIAVTNTTSSDTKNNGAAWGITTIDVGAPGTNVYSTDAFDTYSAKTGTSMATPHIAGTIGLMYSALCPGVLLNHQQHPDSVARLVMETLYNEGLDSIQSLQNITVTGGRLNLFKAVSAISSLGSEECTPANVDPVDPIPVQELLIYPNPADDRVNLKFSASEGSRVTVMSSLGQVVFDRTFTTGNPNQQLILDVQPWASGLYLVRVSTGSDISTAKLLVD